MSLNYAVDKAVDKFISEGVLEDFLSKHRKGAKNILLDLGEVPADLMEKAKTLTFGLNLF